MASRRALGVGTSNMSCIQWFYKNVQGKKKKKKKEGKKSHSILLLALTLPKLNAELRWLCALFFSLV